MYKKTDIEGLILIDGNQTFTDERGFFREGWYRDEFEEFLGKPWQNVQENEIYSKKDVLRGIHAAPWQKLIHVAYGEVLAVIVDLRSDSPTFKKHLKFQLNHQSGDRLFIPPGLGNSYLVLSNEAVVEYAVDKYYKKYLEQGIVERGVSYNDLDLNIDWPIQNPIISQKDKDNLTLKEFVQSDFSQELKNHSTK